MFWICESSGCSSFAPFWHKVRINSHAEFRGFDPFGLLLICVNDNTGVSLGCAIYLMPPSGKPFKIKDLTTGTLFDAGTISVFGAGTGSDYAQIRIYNTVAIRSFMVASLTNYQTIGQNIPGFSM
jgi:hypothetical protein